MNKENVLNAIRIERDAKNYEQKIYNIISILATDAGNTGYAEELGRIDYAADKIIAHEFGLDIDTEYGERIIDDINALIKNSEEENVHRILKETIELVERNNKA